MWLQPWPQTTSNTKRSLEQPCQTSRPAPERSRPTLDPDQTPHKTSGLPFSRGLTVCLFLLCLNKFPQKPLSTPVANPTLPRHPANVPIPTQTALDSNRDNYCICNTFVISCGWLYVCLSACVNWKKYVYFNTFGMCECIDGTSALTGEISRVNE